MWYQFWKDHDDGSSLISDLVLKKAILGQKWAYSDVKCPLSQKANVRMFYKFDTMLISVGRLCGINIGKKLTMEVL